MTPHAVLDACVLIPMPLADTLLQLAEAGHYRPTWSATLLEGTRRNLASKMGLQPARAARRIELMRQAFLWAEADPMPELIDAMTVDAKDRHVAATAVTVGAALIVTYNLKDFPDEALAPLGIRAIHPDEFLLDLLDLDPHGVVTALEQQRRRLKSPAITAAAFHQALAVNVPHFAAEVAAIPAPNEDRSEGTTG
jgi:PIN domain